MRRRALCIVVLFLGALATPGALRSDATDGQKLLSLFGKIQGMTGKFREEKRIALLSAPLINEGTVAYMRPNRFVRHTESPSKSSILVAGDLIDVGTAKDHERFDASSQPVVRAFLDGYLGLMEGNSEKLERAYKVTLTGTPNGGWHLVLTPKNEKLRHILQAIEADGTGDVLATMTVRETSGDVSVTTFTDVDAKHVFDAKEQARVFRLP